MVYDRGALADLAREHVDRPLRPYLVPPGRHRPAGGSFPPDVDPRCGGRLPPTRLLELGNAGAVRCERAGAADPERVPADPAGDAVHGCCPAAHDGADGCRRLADR